MVFHSLDYLVFFVALFALYWQLPRRPQNLLLLVASYFFYGYVHFWFLYLMFASTLLDFLCGLAMDKYPHHKRPFMIVSLVGSLGLLGFFKYFNFFVDNVAVVLNLIGLPCPVFTLRIFLPVGISFYTFQSLSYTIDVYRGLIKARRRFFDFAVFVSFFPQLVAGPIERAKNLLPQFEKDRVFDPDWATRGILLMVWGYYKKLVIADNVGIYCDKVFALSDPGFLLLWSGVFAFTIQLLADFSAYSDIARGSALLFGFKLMRNFNNPYLSKSPFEFWTRWHISLTTWLRDYVLLSLHHSRFFKPHRSFNVMLTFLICGIWHGASWNFVLWGILSGTVVIVYPYFDHATRWLIRNKVLADFFHWMCLICLINLHMLFFREHEVPALVRHLMLNPFANTPLETCAAWQIFVLTLIYSAPLWLHALYTEWGKRLPEGQFPGWTRYTFETCAALVLFVGILLLRCQAPTDFVYFQF